jgi:asparagine synthase (glutamine-hydrolysing)
MHNMLLGKQMHAYWIASIENLLEGYLRDGVVRSFYPLMTQPVVEACLAVPTWQWISGGVNRSVAREAFEAELPPTVRHRRSKGTMDGFVAQLYNRHRAAVRDRLLGGNLVRMGIIDAAAVAAALDACGPLTGFGYGRLMALLDVEVWTGCWGAC